MFNLFRRARRVPNRRANSSCNRFQPRCESLEDRANPTSSAISANFTGSPVPSGAALWFNSEAKFTGVPAAGAVVHISNATVSSPAIGTVSVPDASITFDPNAQGVSNSFDQSGWHITSPVKFGGSVFVDGVVVNLPSGMPGGIKNVVWIGDFTTDSPGLSMNWQWGAAAYSRLADPAALGVKPTDALSLQYLNLDKAGTPENAKLRLIAGGTGGGLLNYTGTPTAAKTVVPDRPAAPAPQATASLSGTVSFNRGTGQGPVTLQLFRTESDGSSTLVATTTSDASTGFYSFANLSAGTYRIVLVPPPAPAGCNYIQTTSQNGWVDGEQDSHATPANEEIDGIALGSGAAGTEYDFMLYYANEG